jgi:DNA-binding transcriptional LysR family regulator
MVKKALLGQVSDSEIRLLQIFKAVVECGGLSAAELELNIGRSTVSRHVRDLEDRLNLVLCRRGRAGFALTADGQRVYEKTLGLLGAIDDFRANVRNLQDEMVGSLALGVFDKTVTNPQAHIGAAIRAFRRAAPDALLDITVGTLTTVEAALIDGRLQVAIVPDHRRSESLSYQEIFRESMYLYCGLGHPLHGRRRGPVDPAQLQKHDYAGLAFHSPNMEAAHRFGLRRRASVSDQEAVATLVLSGCYIGFLPDHYAAAFVRDGLMQRVEHPELRYDVQFVSAVRRSPAPSRLAQAFLDALAAAHPASAGEGAPAPRPAPPEAATSRSR